jgi:hypothetical protein
MVPFAPAVLGTRAVFTASYRAVLPGGPSSAPPARRACQGPRVLRGSRPTPQRQPRPPLKAAGRPARARRCTSLSCRAPLPSTPSSSAFGRSPVPPSCPPRPPQPFQPPAPRSQTGGPPDRAAPRPGRLGATGRPSPADFPPVYGHKPTIGEPLNLLHPSPGRIPHRSGSILASRAGRPSQGPHCKTEVLFEGLPAIGNSNSKSALAVSCKLHRKS